MKRTLGKTRLEIHVLNGVIRFLLFSRRCICKNLEAAAKLSFSQMLFQPNLFCWRKLTLAMFQQSVRNFCPKFVRNERKSVRKSHVRNLLKVMYEMTKNEKSCKDYLKTEL